MSVGVEYRHLEGDMPDKQAGDSSNPDENLRQKFIAYVHKLSVCDEIRSEVWMEHSYARARRGVGGFTSRNLLVRQPSAVLDFSDDENNIVDVTAVEESPKPPLSPRPVPHYEKSLSEDDINSMSENEAEQEDWEEKLDALAPSAAHRRLVGSVLEIVRSLRTARLCGADDTCYAARAHARRLRRELAPLWNYPGPLQQRPAAWMHAVLSAYLPRPYLYLYNDMVSELARSVPKLAERLLAGQVSPAAAEPSAPGPRLRPASDRPLLAWLPSGVERRDAVFENALCQVMPVHRICAPTIDACKPEAWCTAMAASTRSALNNLIHTPRSALIIGGWGAGAALAIHIASTWDSGAGEAPRALVLFSPPLLTAEGPRDSLDDPLQQLKVPVLFVVGQNASQCSVSIAEEVRCRLTPTARLVVVGAADDCLRLTQLKMRTEKVTHTMLLAALAEEVRVFVMQSLREAECSADTELTDEPPSEPEPTPPPARPRHATKRRYGADQVTPSPPPSTSPSLVASSPPTSGTTPPKVAPKTSASKLAKPRQLAFKTTSPGPKGRGLALLRVSSSPVEPAVSQQLPQLSATVRTSTDWEEKLLQEAATRRKKISITENVQLPRGKILNGTSNKGIVVTRGTGSTPLSLPMPRRSTPTAPIQPTINTADIMKLPIVFADDDDATEVSPADDASASRPIIIKPPQVMSINRRSTDSTGAPLKYTKVILAPRPPPSSATRSYVLKGGQSVKMLPKGIIIKRRPAAES